MAVTTMSGSSAPGAEQAATETEPNAKLMEALAADKHQGLRLAVRARFVALAVVAPLLVFQNPTWNVLYYQAILIGFALIGWAQLRIGRVGCNRVASIDSIDFFDAGTHERVFDRSVDFQMPLKNESWQVLGQALQARLAFAKSLFGPFGLGDIGMHTSDVGRSDTRTHLPSPSSISADSRAR